MTIRAMIITKIVFCHFLLSTLRSLAMVELVWESDRGFVVILAVKLKRKSLYDSFRALFNWYIIRIYVKPKFTAQAPANLKGSITMQSSNIGWQFSKK